MRVARVSTSLRASCHSLGAPLNYVWISDELLQATLNRFTSKYNRRCIRRGSNVPGPLEAQKRLSRRRINAVTLGNELPGVPDLTEQAGGPSWRSIFKWRDPYREPPTSAKQLVYQAPAPPFPTTKAPVSSDPARQHSGTNKRPVPSNLPLQTVQDIYIDQLQQTTSLAELKALNLAYIQTRFDLPAFADQVVEHVLKLEPETHELLELLVEPFFMPVAEKADPAILGLLIRSCVASADDIPRLVDTISQHAKQHEATHYLGPLLSAMMFCISEEQLEFDACKVVRSLWELTVHLLPRLGQQRYEELYCDMLDSLASVSPTTNSAALLHEMIRDDVFQKIADPDLLSSCVRHVLISDIQNSGKSDAEAGQFSFQLISTLDFVKALGEHQVRLVAKALTRRLREEYRETLNADLINAWVYALHAVNANSSNVAENELWIDVFGTLRELSPSVFADFFNSAHTDSICILLLRHWIIPDHPNLALVEETFKLEIGEGFFYAYHICESACALQRLVLSLARNSLNFDTAIQTIVELYTTMNRPTVVYDFLLSLKILNNKKKLNVQIPAALVQNYISKYVYARPRLATILYKVTSTINLEDCPDLVLGLIASGRIRPRQVTSLLEHRRGSLRHSDDTTGAKLLTPPPAQGITEAGEGQSKALDTLTPAQFAARADILHEAALEFAYSPQWRCYTAFRLAQLCVEWLLEGGATVDSRVTRALLHAAIERPVAEGKALEPEHLAYTCETAERTEEPDVAAELRDKMHEWDRQSFFANKRAMRDDYAVWLARNTSLSVRKPGWAAAPLRFLD